MNENDKKINRFSVVSWNCQFIYLRWNELYSLLCDARILLYIIVNRVLPITFIIFYLDVRKSLCKYFYGYNVANYKLVTKNLLRGNSALTT